MTILRILAGFFMWEILLLLFLTAVLRLLSCVTSS